MTTELGHRLKEARKALGLSQTAVAKAADMAQSTYQDLEAGKSKKSAYLAKIAAVLKKDAYWLETGLLPEDVDARVKELLDSSPNVGIQSEQDGDGKFWVDLVNIRFSCGNGESIEFHYDEVVGRREIPASVFRKYNVKPENTKMAKSTGDSQEPYICTDDEFAIDLADTQVKDGEFYAVYFEGEAMLKQLFKEEGGKLILHSLNPKYKDKVVTDSNGIGFRIIGRQFYRAG